MYACTMDGRTCWTNAQRGRYRKAVGGRNGKEPQVCFPGIEWALFAQKGRSRVQRSFQETYIPQPINPFYHNTCPIVRTLSRKGWKFLGGESLKRIRPYLRNAFSKISGYMDTHKVPLWLYCLPVIFSTMAIVFSILAMLLKR